jgi:aminobenzoyl-glutamate utilization protein B
MQNGSKTRLEQKDITASYSMLGLGVQRDKVLADFFPPLGHQSNDLPASTDVGDVSWVVPTVQLWGANYAIGTPYHTWQMVAQGKSSTCIKGHGACRNDYGDDGCGRDHQSRAARCCMGRFENTCRRRGYVSALPDDAEPPIKEMAG